MKISKIIQLAFLSLFLSVILTLTTEYGIITYLTKYSQPYSSDEQLLKSFKLDNLSDEEKVWQIYSNVEKLEHKFTYYSWLENPVSIIFEIIIFEPLYEIIANKKSQFLNTLREPYLLFNAGGGICSQSAIAMVKLAEKIGLEGRVIWLEGHGVAEIYYDNAWHLFDADMGVAFKEDEHILSYNEIINHPDLLHHILEKKKLEIGLNYPFTYLPPQEIAELYITTHNNHFYHLHPYETYIKVYYFLTRLFSYMLYFIVFFSVSFFFIKKVSKLWLKTIDK
jgi:hypothetical protein